MAALNSVSYICSAGLNSVTSAGSLGPYFAIKYFLPLYDYSIDSTICKLTSGAYAAKSVSALNLTSATSNSLSGFEVIYKTNPFGSYTLSEAKSVYYTAGMGAGPYYTNIRQTVFDNKVNSLNASPLSNIVTASTWTNPSVAALSASGGYGNINALSFNPLSASTSAWANYLYRVNSYSPTEDTSAGYARGSFKCRIPSGPGSFKFNAMALFATRVNQFGYDDPGVQGAPFNPTLFAIVVFDAPQIKNDLAGALNAFELNVELNFQLANPSSQMIFVNKDYFSRIPTSNVTSAYALSYDGDLVLSTSAEPGSWVPRAKATFVDPEKDQLRLAYDENHFTTLRTKSVSPNPLYVTDSQKMSVLSIDTACPDDALLQIGYNCVATGIKSFAGGCFTSATGLNESNNIDFGSTSPSINTLYTGGRGGYTFAFGVDSIASGLVSQAFGLETSSIGFSNLAVGYRSYAESPMGHTEDSLPVLGGNVAIGFGTSAHSIDSFYITPDEAEYESCSNLSTLVQNYEVAGGNFATNVYTVASGKGAAAFGIATKSLGNATASFGLTTSAIGCAATTFGTNTKAVGEMTIAAGYKTSAHGAVSFVGGSHARTSKEANGSFVWAGQNYGNPQVIKRNVYKYENGSIVAIAQEMFTIEADRETFALSPSSLVIGKGTSASGYGPNFGIGVLNELSDGSSYAFGLGNSATSTNTFAIGEFNIVDGFASMSFGSVNTVNGAYSMAIGENNISNGATAYTFGVANTNAGASLEGSYVIGAFNTNNGNNIVIGYKNIANGINNIVLGSEHTVNGNKVTHIGSSNKSVGGSYTINGFVGGEKSAVKATTGGTAIRSNGADFLSSYESFTGSMFAFGYGASALNAGAISLGSMASSEGMNSVSIGANSYSVGANSLGLGYYSKAVGENSVSLGVVASALGRNSIAVGSVTATDDYSVVIGNTTGNTFIKSNEIYLAASRFDGIQSVIQLDADKIILNGYNGDKERYYFAVSFARNRDAMNNGASGINIKISKVRCDILAGNIEGLSIQVYTDNSKSGDVVTVWRYINGAKSVVPGYSYAAMDVGLIMFNPTTMDVFFGNSSTSYTDIVAKLASGWVYLAEGLTGDNIDTVTSKKIAHCYKVQYWLFNDIRQLSVKTFSNDLGGPTIDYINTRLKKYSSNGTEFAQQFFTSNLDILSLRVNNTDNSGNYGSYILFENRDASVISLNTNTASQHIVGIANAVTSDATWRCLAGRFQGSTWNVSTSSAQITDDGLVWWTPDLFLLVDYK